MPDRKKQEAAQSLALAYDRGVHLHLLLRLARIVAAMAWDDTRWQSQMFDLIADIERLELALEHEGGTAT